MVSPSGSLGQRGRKLRAQVTTLQGAAAARDLEWHPEGPGAGALWPGHALLCHGAPDGVGLKLTITLSCQSILNTALC